MRASLSEQDARDLADRFAAIARGLDDYVLKMGAVLRDDEIRHLTNLAMQIRDASVEMSGLANQLAMDDLDLCLSRLKSATTDLLAAVKKVNWPNRIIRLAAAGVDLGLAVTARDPAAIFGAIETARTAIRETA